MATHTLEISPRQGSGNARLVYLAVVCRLVYLGVFCRALCCLAHTYRPVPGARTVRAATRSGVAMRSSRQGAQAVFAV